MLIIIPPQTIQTALVLSFNHFDIFGIFKALAIKFQNVSFRVLGLQLSISAQIMDMMPYVLTIVVLVIAAVTGKERSGGPAATGKPYYREDR